MRYVAATLTRSVHSEKPYVCRIQPSTQLHSPQDGGALGSCSHLQTSAPLTGRPRTVRPSRAEPWASAVRGGADTTGEDCIDIVHDCIGRAPR
jgi:hypothetical protein